MKIILLEDVKKQGKKGQIINVKDGYGNFLINDKKAVMASDNNIKKLEKDNEKKQKLNEEEIKKCNKLSEKLSKEVLEFKVKTGALDKVFGSVSPKQIVQKLTDKGYKLDKKQIKLEDALATLGMHNVSIILHKEVVATIKVNLIK